MICHFYLKGLDAVCYDKETTIWGECKFSCLKIILLFKEAKQYSEHHWKFKCLCSLIQHCYTNSVYSFPETESSLRKRGLRFCAAHPLKSMICDRRSLIWTSLQVHINLWPTSYAAVTILGSDSVHGAGFQYLLTHTCTVMLQSS